MSNTTHIMNDPIPNSPSSSEEDLPSSNASPSPTTATLQRELHFSQTSTFPARDVDITNTNHETLYSAKTSQYTPNTPDMIFSTPRPDIKAHVYIRFAGSIRIGIGADENAMEWTEMKRQTMTGVKKAFIFEHKGKTFVLSRNRDVQGLKKAMLGHFKVVEEGSTQPLALYVAEEAIGKRKGTLRLRDDMQPDLEVLIVCGIAAWREKTRRRQRLGGRMVI